MEVAGYYDEGSFAFHGRDSIITPISGSHWKIGDSMTELGFEERERAIDFSVYLDTALHCPQQAQPQGDIFSDFLAENKIKRAGALQNYKNYALLEGSQCDNLRDPREYAQLYADRSPTLTKAQTNAIVKAVHSGNLTHLLGVLKWYIRLAQLQRITSET